LGIATTVRVGSCREQNTNREQDLGPQWFFRRMKTASPEQYLEDEIYFLRRRMEQMFNQEQSLTSDSVLELSHLLDYKINGYMHRMSRNR
jgi:hypothetical protein